MEKPPEVNVEAGKIIDALRSGQPGVIEKLYSRHGAKFLAWAKKAFDCTEDDAKKIWADVIVAFDRKVKSGQYTELSCSIETFLFAIGKYMLRKIHEKMNRPKWKMYSSGWEGDVDNLLALDPKFVTFNFDNEDDIWEEERLILLESMNKLTPRCRKILNLRHYKEWSIVDLMEEFGYSSKAVVSVVLNDCFKALLKIIKEKTEK